MKFYKPRIKIRLGRFHLNIYAQMFIGFKISQKELIRKLRGKLNDLPMEERTALLNLLNDIKGT